MLGAKRRYDNVVCDAVLRKNMQEDVDTGLYSWVVLNHLYNLSKFWFCIYNIRELN